MTGSRSVRVAGHFGEFLQGRLGPSGPVALVTLPCPVLAARAICLSGNLSLHVPGVRLFTAAQLQAFAAALGLQHGRRFAVRLEMPVGGGAGASTAALVAMARAAGVRDARQIAAGCLAAEGASDPLMLPGPGGVLWASRQGKALATLPEPARIEVLGGFLGPAERTDPQDTRFANIADLVAAWPAATADARAMAQLASQSAARSLALRGRGADPTADLAARHGALGWSIAHTGPARALLFRPGTVPAGARDDLRRAGFRQIVQYRTGGDA